MPTRRGFLLASAAALTVKNRRAEAVPISAAEREGRLERARKLMGEQKISAIVLAGGTSLDYFTALRWGNSERLFAFVLPQSGKPFYIAPAFEEDRVKERMSQSARIYTWQEDDNPYARLAQGLRDAGVSTGRIGIEEKVPFVFADSIGKAAPAMSMVSATPVTAGCRAAKSAAELKLMQLANDITLQVYEAAWKALQPGMTNREFTDLINTGYKQAGFPGEAGCQVDTWSALPHGSAQPQVIKEGSIVLIDDGCIVEGYQSDLSRTFVLGKPTEKMKRVFDVVHRAQTAARAAAKPGVPCEAVDAAARKVVDDAGFGPGYAHFTHRVGHGIGMDMHEWPYLVKGNRQPLAAGMTTSDEPGIYLAGEFGIRLEDDMHITPSGAEWFTPQSPSLEEPFAR
ncbi:MAG TPA: Xaa-Pro peptidase family protein [Bryobacteraceae bacterium]|jgi:Xaa-Pro dipeptidase|nr:Xaa-Pro peptidase family protein [Bryobacteraceae bacterium]